MKKYTIYVVLIIILLLFLGALYSSYSTLSKDGVENSPVDDPEKITEPLELIHIKHQFKNGIHIFAGNLIIDNDCSDRLESVVLEVGPTLSFTTVDDDPNGVCTKENFKVYPYKLFHTADELTEFKAVVNGVPVRLNIYEISPDEDIDEVDLFIKG